MASYNLKLKQQEPFAVRDKPTQAQIRRRLGPIRIINLIPHTFRKGAHVAYKPTPRSSVVEAMILGIACVKNKPAYILDNGQWIYQNQILGAL